MNMRVGGPSGAAPVPPPPSGEPSGDFSQNPEFLKAMQEVGMNVLQDGQAKMKESMEKLNEKDEDEEEDDPDGAL